MNQVLFGLCTQNVLTWIAQFVLISVTITLFIITFICIAILGEQIISFIKFSKIAYRSILTDDRPHVCLNEDCLFIVFDFCKGIVQSNGGFDQIVEERGGAGNNEDLYSYLISFAGEKCQRIKSFHKKRKSSDYGKTYNRDN